MDCMSRPTTVKAQCADDSNKSIRSDDYQSSTLHLSSMIDSVAHLTLSHILWFSHILLSSALSSGLSPIKEDGKGRNAIFAFCDTMSRIPLGTTSLPTCLAHETCDLF
jgi:hypothetical protein